VGAVVLFNLIAIFGPHALLHDDPAGYWTMVQGSFLAWARGWGRFNVLLPLTEGAGWTLMTLLRRSSPGPST
jgi:hypothetical protein